MKGKAAVTAGCVAVLVSCVAQAQQYPTRPVRVIVPYESQKGDAAARRGRPTPSSATSARA